MTGHLEVFGPGPGQFIWLAAVWMLITLWWGLVGTRLTWRRKR